MVIFSVIYLLFLFAYFITRVGNNMKLRAINKYILASMYLVYAIVMFFLNDLSNIHYVLLLALLFAFLGDVLLVFSFSKGGMCFLLSNITFSLFYLINIIEYKIPFFNYFWIFILSIILICLFLFLSNKYPQKIKLGKMKYPMTLYLTSITLHGLFGLVSAIFISTTSFVLMGIGSLLFMLSDYILTIDRFIIKNNKWIIRSNSLTYFVGLLLIVVSIGL